MDDSLREANDPVPSRRRILWEQILSVQRGHHFRSDQLTAQRAANTIYNARNLLQGSNLFGMFSSGPQPVSPVTSEASHNSPRRPGEGPEFHSSPNIPLACLIAARVSQKLKFVYALARLAISMEIMSVPTIDLDPTHSPNIPRSDFPEDHVRMATAITSAYSSLEELGLTIRASNQKPSRIDGAWNPVVKDELDQRLTNAGVDLAEDSIGISVASGRASR